MNRAFPYVENLLIPLKVDIQSIDFIEVGFSPFLKEKIIELRRQELITHTSTKNKLVILYRLESLVRVLKFFLQMTVEEKQVVYPTHPL